MNPKCIPILAILLFFSARLFAQFQPAEMTITLNPIAIESGKYYFNGKRTTFDGLLVPLQAINDQKTDRNIKTILGLRTTQHVIRIGTTIYLFHLVASANQSAYINPKQFQILFYGTVGLHFSVKITEIIFQRKAIKRFNKVVTKND